MNQHHEKPVILGSSMSGILISLSLSRAGIDHIVVGGDEPPEIPRLGESLNECAGPELWRLFGREFKQYFYTKSHISLLNGDFASMAHIANPNRRKKKLQRFTAEHGERKRITLAQTLLHVDRIGFDRDLYHKAREQKTCNFIKGLVTDLQFDSENDTFQSIRLDNGTVIERPKYVFDATGPRGIAADAAGVERKPISNLQRVVWTHHVCPDGDSTEASSPPDRPWWQYGTNLLRLDRENDGVDGIAWLIPLGSALSLGISVDADTYGSDVIGQDELIERLDEAFARRGVDYRPQFSARRQTQEIKHRYFVRDRAFGANWLLAAGTFVQIWFPSSAGLWTANAAAAMAPELIDDPQQRGKKYEMMMRRLLVFHDVLEDMIHSQPFRDKGEVEQFWAKWIAGIPIRLSDYIRISRDQLGSRRPLYWYLENVTRFYRRFLKIQLLTWGFFVLRVERQPELSRQSESFPDYFRVIRFRTSNYFRGLWRSFRSLFVKTGSTTVGGKSAKVANRQTHAS